MAKCNEPPDTSPTAAASTATSELTIVTWNINGIRAAKLPLKSMLDSLDGDVICLQETKTTRDLMEETLANVNGYNSYFSFSRRRSGYSGVATFCRYRATPVAAEEGLTGAVATNLKDTVGCYDTGDVDQESLRAIDAEGRAIITKHCIRLNDEGDERKLVIINVYCPRADPEKPERLKFKLQFYQLLRLRAIAIMNTGCHVIIVGDLNTSHKPIDHCDPGDLEEFSRMESRVFLDQFLVNDSDDKDSNGNVKKFVDTFRHLHPDERNAFTCWNTSSSARQTNYGTRIDYILADKRLVDAKSVLKRSEILPDVTGSDHCPVRTVLLCTPLASSSCPSFCSKYWPEFAGKQTKLFSFFDRQKSRTGTCSADVPPTSAAKSKTKLINQKDLKYFFESSADTKKIRLEESEASKVSESKPTSKAGNSAVNAWKVLFKEPKQKQSPLCQGHGEPCVLRTVKKQGPNYRRDFYVCARPEGHATNPESRCDFFKWAKAINEK